MRLFSTVLLAVALPGCSREYPIAVVSKDLPGGIMRGSGIMSPFGGDFHVTDGKLRCVGSYDGTDTSRTITIPVLCNDGRKGLATVTRNDRGDGGGGRFTLNDGMTGDVIFGPGAGRL